MADCKFDFSDPNLDDFLESAGTSMRPADPSNVPSDPVWEEMKVPDGASVDSDAEKTQLDTPAPKKAKKSCRGRTD